MYIDPNLVVDKESFKLIEVNAICAICKGVIISPVQCMNCKKLFCEKCISTWKKTKKNNQCPFKCKNPTFKPPRMFKNLLEKVKFKCEKGCDQEIPYGDLEQHYNETCPKLVIDFKAKYFEYKKKYQILEEKFKNYKRDIEKKIIEEKQKYEKLNQEFINLKNGKLFEESPLRIFKVGPPTGRYCLL